MFISRQNVPNIPEKYAIISKRTNTNIKAAKNLLIFSADFIPQSTIIAKNEKNIIPTSFALTLNVCVPIAILR